MDSYTETGGGIWRYGSPWSAVFHKMLLELSDLTQWRGEPAYSTALAPRQFNSNNSMEKEENGDGFFFAAPLSQIVKNRRQGIIKNHILYVLINLMDFTKNLLTITRYIHVTSNSLSGWTSATSTTIGRFRVGARTWTSSNSSPTFHCTISINTPRWPIAIH